MGEHVIGLDLDHTCIHHEGVREAIIDFSHTLEVDARTATRALASTAIAFTCERFLETIERQSHMADFEAILARVFAANVYDDVVPFLVHARHQRSRIALVTRGNTHLQSLKADSLRGYADTLIITDRIGQKGWRLREHYADAQHVTVVDDRQDELNAVKEAFAHSSSALQLYQIVRPDSTYPIGRHPLITSLNDIRN